MRRRQVLTADALLRSRIRALIVVFIALCTHGCATVPFDEPKIPSFALADTADTTFGRAANGWAELHDGSSGFFPLVQGMDALGARLDLIEQAEKSIDLQYFLMKDDTAGYAIGHALIRAADRGVRVRFLLDDVFTTVSDRMLYTLSQHPNVEVRLFNPVARRGFYALNFVASFRRANRRMHNKSFTVDNAISIVGGRNIADEYFQLKDDAVFSDFDILALGDIAKAVSTSFDIYWNHALAVPIEILVGGREAEALREERSAIAEKASAAYQGVYATAVSSELLQALTSGEQTLYAATARVLADDPDKLSNPVGVEYMGLVTDIETILREAEREVTFISPYYVPVRNGVRYLRELGARGVRVSVVTNSLASNNHVPVHSAYSGYRKDVIRAGVNLYEARANAGDEMQEKDGPASMTLHTKLILIDRRYVFVGSLNLDPRSIEINAEMGLLIESAELASQMADGLDAALPVATWKVTLDDGNALRWHGLVKGNPVTLTSEPLASRWLRFKAWLLKIAPESQL